jgi:hypothetical protein
MARLKPEKLTVHFLQSHSSHSLALPRRYTLTHSDRTGDLFLTIGSDYNYNQIKGWYARLMRDEVLAELVQDPSGYSIHIYCEVCHGFGTRRLREFIIRRELPLVLEAIRYGDRELFDKESELDASQIIIHFCAKKPENDCIEKWGPISKYALSLS